MKNFLVSWVDSLALLKPQNLKNFALVTVNAWLQLYWVLFKNFWWLVIGGVFAVTVRPHWLLLGLLIIAWFLGVILAARPSVQRKTFGYFMDYALYSIPLLIVFLFPCCVPALVAYGSVPYLVLVMLFLCDAERRLVPFLLVPVQAAAMSFYKLPLYIIFAVLFYVASFIPVPLNFFITIPLIVTALSRCYIIWLHKDYKDYHEGCC